MKLRILQGIANILLAISCYSTTHIEKENNQMTSIILQDSSYSNSTQYSKFAETKLKTKRLKIKDENLEETIIYLGDIKLKEKRFYIITSFQLVQAAITKHGHSTIIILDSKKKNYKEIRVRTSRRITIQSENQLSVFSLQRLHNE